MNDNNGTEDDYGQDDDQSQGQSSSDLFGRYSVVGPGVHIVLDGKPVSRCSEGF